MRKLIYLLALCTPTLTAQCDVSINSWNAITGDIVIEAISSENCGCNEFTVEDSTCDNSASPHVNNNTTVSHIVLGLHSPGLDYTWGCTTATNHPGWTFKVVTLFGNQVLESGDTWSANVYDYGSFTNDCWSEMLANDTLCMELVIWQINLSQTATTDNGGWAVNPNLGNQTQNYPDVNLDDNGLITCALPACDTIYENIYITDTIIEYIDVEWITTDTLYITDTIEFIEYIYITDTIVLIEVDTLVEYIQLPGDTVTLYEVIYIDCYEPCSEATIFVPNTVTPNGDGINDVWGIVYLPECFSDVEVAVYNRWGELIWEGYGMEYWYPDNVSAGVYVYRISIPGFEELLGHITVIY
tara:strand:+ start:4567 stop:5634 length:1068 start_codon:yes stop_codon:yes gene_type:complete